ncbi:TPA: hypothetical protein P2I16_004548 [Aeromonas salmonicida]|uniref:DUF7424 family protein n=1 Tax=Aeromonas sp. D3 TaxID=2990474 RepID=UPI0022DEFAD1|nr:hypothetical protein [Aeromonas sp. D3]HDN9020181.1 hypothetical protein [Aeromonas salmonicida]HDN9022431.1 hypothetical protein [Aeromonas salmonicida]
MKLPILLAFPFIIFGCKTQLMADVNVSDLNNTNLQNGAASLLVEVASCNSYEDSRNPSSSVIEAQKTVPQLIDGAEYQECFTQKMDSYVMFSIPIQIGKFKSEDDFKTKGIKIYSYDGDDAVLGIRIPKSIRDNLEKHNKQDFQTNKIQLESAIIVVNLLNDTKNKVKFNVFKAFIDGKPMSFVPLELPPSGRTQITLSNIDAATLFYPNDHGGQGFVNVLFK